MNPEIQKLSQAFLPGLIALRHQLHRHPNRSGEEGPTARLMQQFMEAYEPDQVMSELGGYGIAFIFNGRKEGPTLMVRCELDALPIQEVNGFAHRSQEKGTSHKCGHDGHMAMVAGLAPLVAHHPLDRGRLVLLFQPEEETGEGAARVLADPRFRNIKPDAVFALHNLPSQPLRSVFIRPEAFSCASVGMVATLRGVPSHAAYPEDGLSPAKAMCDLVTGLNGLPYLPEFKSVFSRVTVIHARLGEIAFGTAPGDAVVMATLRSDSDCVLEQMKQRAAKLVADQAPGLTTEIQWQDAFPTVFNHPRACERVARAASSLGLEQVDSSEIIRFSEDFGRFTEIAEGAMFGPRIG